MLSLKATLNTTLETAWDAYINPKHIINWNFASEDWCCPSATNTLEVGGAFSYRMEAKDGSFGFDLNGTFTDIIPNKLLKYSLEDDRKVEIAFYSEGSTVRIEGTFEPESENPLELQQQGWQSILDNFKKYADSL